MEDTSCPRLSVVIASHNAAQVIAACLSALTNQPEADLMEIIVADSSNDCTAEIVREQFLTVKLIHSEEPLTIPQLRGRALAATQANIIAILDPYSIVASDWAKQLLHAHEEHPQCVIGGTVDLHEPAEQGLLSWATYINEYGMFMSPLREGDMEILAGSNISYKRSALMAAGAWNHAEFWKTFVNWHVQEHGGGLFLDPAVRIHLYKPISFPDFLRSRFFHGRCFAARRVQHDSFIVRALRIVTTPFLPPMFVWRWGQRYWQKRRYRHKFILTLPLQLLLFGNWALGELIGYSIGEGESCRQLFY